MRPLFIIENHILVNCRSEFIFGTVFCAIQFFPLKTGEKGFHHRIIIRNVCSGKGLGNAKRFQELTESFGLIIGSSIRVKSQRFLWLSQLIGHLKRAFRKVGAIILANPVSYDSPSEQIQNHTNVIVLLRVAETGNIAYPNFIWASDSELLIQIILERARSLSYKSFAPCLILVSPISLISSETNRRETCVPFSWITAQIFVAPKT